MPFQATNCATLGLSNPAFSRLDIGEDLARERREPAREARLSQSCPFGSQSNIALVKVSLPKQLPSRLTTLQQACTDTRSTRPRRVSPRVARRARHAITPVVPVPWPAPPISSPTVARSSPNW